MNEQSAGYSNGYVSGTLGGGRYIPETTNVTYSFAGDAAKSSVPVGAVKIDGASVSRVVRVALTNAPYDEVTAETDPDTGVVNLTIGCQTHSLERWERVGPRLIQRQYGEASVKRLGAALTEVIRSVRNALKVKKAA